MPERDSQVGKRRARQELCEREVGKKLAARQPAASRDEGVVEERGATTADREDAREREDAHDTREGRRGGHATLRRSREEAKQRRREAEEDRHAEDVLERRLAG